MQWTVTTPPTSEPLDYATVKTQCRLDGDDEQTWIESYVIPAARATCEKATGLALMTQTITAIYYPQDSDRYTGEMWTYPHQVLELPRGPVVSITSITDADGNAVPTSNYRLEMFGLTSRIRFTVAAKAPITIVYAAGFASATRIPADLRGAMLAHCAFMYENRSADASPTALDIIYRQYRSSVH
jgi:uncharacterized phiE125 gp8 family phage protein